MKQRGTYSDKDLLAMIKEGGLRRDQAMAHLYRQHLGKITAFVRSRNGAEEEAKDVFQDAIINLMESILSGKFEGKSSLSTYLFAISKHLWYRRFSRSQRMEPLDPLQTEQQVAEPEPEILLISQDQQIQLERLLGNLKDKCREVLLLWSMKYSMKEIAEKLGYQNDQVVRNKKNHCMKELKELVRKHPEVRKLVEELTQKPVND